jgi:hypothetical protein
VRRTVSDAQAGTPANRLLSGKCWGHRDYNSSDCPMCTGLSGVPAARLANGRPRDQRVTCGLANGQKVAPDCPVCHETSGWQCQLRQKRNEITHCSLSGGAPDYPVRPWTECNQGLPNGTQTAPSCLGAIKGTPRRMEQYTKHSSCHLCIFLLWLFSSIEFSSLYSYHLGFNPTNIYYKPSLYCSDLIFTGSPIHLPLDALTSAEHIHTSELILQSFSVRKDIQRSSQHWMNKHLHWFSTHPSTTSQIKRKVEVKGFPTK